MSNSITKAHKKVSGIYAIVNKVNGKRYIGSSQNLYDRWQRHRRLLNRGKHHSTYLQRAWDKYGGDNFRCVVLLECDEDFLIKREQYLLDHKQPEYNMSPTASSVRGVIRTKEYRRKQSKSQSGKTLSEETKRKISEGMKGKRNSLGTTRNHSEEMKRKISETLMGHEVSEETRRKISKKNKGYRHTEEAKKRIAAASKGNSYASRKQSPEEKEKRAASLREYWRKKRAARNDDG